jgi:hypothetical protein
LRDKTNTDVDTLRHEGREKIRAFLTDEQKPKFEEYVRKIDEEHKKQQGMQQK